MRKLILWWLFGTSDIDDYMDLLRKDLDHLNEEHRLIDDHLKLLDRQKWALDTLRKLIRICENHGIDVDEEIKHMELEENADEDLD